MADDKVEWNVEDLLLGRTTQELEDSIKDNVKIFTKYRDQLKDTITAERLKEIIELKQTIIFDLEGLQDYYGMQFTINTKDQNVLAKMTYYDQLSLDLGNQMLFFSLWFMHLNDEKAQALIEDPLLQDYKYYLTSIRKAKPYTKDEATEQIINIKDITSGSHSQLYDILTNNFSYEFEGKKGLTQDELKKHVFDHDPKKRKEAYEKLFVPYKENDALLTELYKNVVLDWDNESMKIRGYETPISVRNNANDIDNEAVHALMQAVRKHSKVFTEYFALRKKINEHYGAEYENSRYHIYAPFAGETKKEYSYTESKKLVLETYKQFDTRFYEAAQAIFDANHVHSHPQPNKRSGAFCSYLGGLIKPYIFLNHNGSTRDVFTMMHEFGHGIHGVLAEKQQPLMMHAALPMAETASIMGEMILASRLLQESQDEKEKIGLLMQLLDNEWASITRQVYFAVFEEIAHEKIREGATKEELDTIYMDLLKEQFGEDMDIPEIYKHEWNYIPHIHHTPFYVYAYAWGNLLVLTLYDEYKKQGQPFVEKLVDLLAAGGSKRPQDLLLDLGMDATQESFWERGFSIIEEQIKELKEISKQ